MLTVPRAAVHGWCLGGTGAVFFLMHRHGRISSVPRTSTTSPTPHDVQRDSSRGVMHCSIARRHPLAASVIESIGPGRRGLDVGCGRGSRMGRMCEMGFAADGIDMSAGRCVRFSRNVGGEGTAESAPCSTSPRQTRRSTLPTSSNVLHHLNSIDEQRAAFKELLRVEAAVCCSSTRDQHT